MNRVGVVVDAAVSVVVAVATSPSEGVVVVVVVVVAAVAAAVAVVVEGVKKGATCVAANVPSPSEGVLVVAVAAAVEVVVVGVKNETSGAAPIVPSPSEGVVVVVIEGAEVWPVVAETLVVIVAAAAVAVVMVAGVKSEAPGAAASVPVVGLVEKAKVCEVGAADLANSGAAPAALVGPPNCRVGVAVEAVGSWKPENPVVLVVAGAGTEKQKDEETEEAGGARNPAPGDAVCCC